MAGIALSHSGTGEEEPKKAAVSDRTDEYRDRWNENLFLHRRQRDRDKRVCPDTLYVPPHYQFNGEDADEAKFPMLDELTRPGGHLVLGDPGIGKSTLISWFLNSSKHTALVYPLTAFTLNLDEKHPGEALLEQMGRARETMKQTVLFLDGLDECSLTPEQRAGFLRDVGAYFGTHFPWVVTCRLNYIPERELKYLPMDIITLRPLDLEQMERYLTRYHAATGTPIPAEKRAALLSKKHEGDFGSPFGIPLILYMALSPEVTVTEDSLLVDIYDQLFPALYRRQYDTSGHPLTDGLQDELHQMSRYIALWMLLHNSETASIPSEEYREIEQSFGGELAEKHVHQIGSYFRDLRHTEEADGLCFIHRTMYEYFVADGFVNLAVRAKTPEELSRVIAWYWYADTTGDTQWNYVAEKLNKHRSGLNYALWEGAGLRLMELGVRRCWADGVRCPDCLNPSFGETLVPERKSEACAFSNLGSLLNLVRKVTEPSTLIFAGLTDRAVLESAILHSGAVRIPVDCPFFDLSRTNLSLADLSDADLSRANLSGAYLSRADLSCADLSGAYLFRANLSGAYLSRANLVRANLFRAHLSRADLSRAYLSRANLSGANLSGANLVRADLSGADLSGADLLFANLSDAVLSGADLSDVDLSYANLSDADLYDAKLSGTNLNLAVFSEDQPAVIGYNTLAGCSFDKIRIGLDKYDPTTYTREEFFARFFPGKPCPPNPE